MKFSCHAARHGRAAGVAGLLLALCACNGSSLGFVDDAATVAADYYVRTMAADGGDGSHEHPFNSLQAVEQVSQPGDTIVVLAAPLSVPPLDGGIALKPDQRLIGQGDSPTAAARLTNSSSTDNSGNAVVLAPGAEVAGLTITGTYRGGIYGLNVPGVSVHNNDISGHNTSCSLGIVIPSDILPTTVPGLTLPNPLPLPNGWAGIFIRADRGEGEVSIHNNVVHDSPCGDGIDIGLSGSAVYSALIDGNTVFKLTQSTSGLARSAILSVLAIGMQTRDSARLIATVSNNVQHDIGTANSNSADPECVYPNVVDASTIIADITHNRCYNSIGGWSANGLEIPMMGDGGSAIINVSDSSFTNISSDIIEPIALGTNQYLEVNLTRVTAAHANGRGASPLIDIAGQFSYGNEGDCLSMFSTAACNTLKLTMHDSVLSDCYFNGLSIASNNMLGSAATQSISFDIENSRITANHGNGIRFYNGAGLERLHGKVQNSSISGNATTPNLLAPRYNINISNQGGATPDVVLDFGGGALGSTGGNCIVGSGVSNSGYSVSMRNNWWGSAEGPANGRLAGSGTTYTLPVSSTAPAACQ